MILPGTTPMTEVSPLVPAMRIVRRDALGPHGVETDWRHGAARGEERIVHQASARDHVGYRAGLEIVQQHDVGTLAGRDHAAVAQAEGPGRRQATLRDKRRAVRSRADELAEHEVQMALFGDVERVVVVVYRGPGTGGSHIEEGCQRVQVAPRPSLRVSGRSCPCGSSRALLPPWSSRGPCGYPPPGSR